YARNSTLTNAQSSSNDSSTLSRLQSSYVPLTAKIVAPYTDVATSFSGSRSAGQKTAASMPSAAARAATAFARFPVDEHASVSSPSSFAFAAATATTRSLNECVGFAVSSLSQSSPSPSASASRGAGRSGVNPGARRASVGGATGSSGE